MALLIMTPDIQKDFEITDFNVPGDTLIEIPLLTELSSVGTDLSALSGSLPPISCSDSVSVSVSNKTSPSLSPSGSVVLFYSSAFLGTLPIPSPSESVSLNAECFLDGARFLGGIRSVGVHPQKDTHPLPLPHLSSHHLRSFFFFIF